MSPKTKKILVMKANGLSSKDIARAVGVNRRTVEWHLSEAGSELKSKNTCNTVAKAMRNGVISAGEILCVAILCWSGFVFDGPMRSGPRIPTVRSTRQEVII